MLENFNYQPTLKGDKLSIRPITVDDYAQLFVYASDKKLWEGHPAKDRYKEMSLKNGLIQR